MISSAKSLVGLEPPNSEAILFFGSITERNSVERFNAFFEDCDGQTIVAEVFSDAHFERLCQFNRGDSIYLRDFFVLPMKELMERVPFRYSIKVLKTTTIERQQQMKEYKKGDDWQPTIFADLKESVKREKRDAFYVRIISVSAVEQMETPNENTRRTYDKTRVVTVRDVKGNNGKLRLNGKFINRIRPTDEGKFVDLYSINVETDFNTSSIVFFPSPGLFEVNFC